MTLPAGLVVTGILHVFWFLWSVMLLVVLLSFPGLIFLSADVTCVVDKVPMAQPGGETGARVLCVLPSFRSKIRGD